jgi:CRP-like cAMP-binding protein
MKPSSVQQPYNNKLLASLSKPLLERLSPHLVPLTLKKDRTLHNAGEPIETVYFLEEGIASIVVALESGAVVEVGLVGTDGLVGLPGVWGTGPPTNRGFIQLPGRGFGVKVKIVQELYEQSGEFRLCLHRGVQGYLAQVAQTAACNRVHELEERLARWLLMCHDRMPSDKLPITHEFLAMMLGTRRTSVTVAAGTLQKAGLIEYSRGHVTIIDRKRLERAACECHSVVRAEYVRLGLL